MRQRPRGSWRNLAGALGALPVLLMVASSAGPGAAAAIDPGLPEGVRIYRAFDRSGRPTLVLTNLDEEGNLLPGASQATPAPLPGAEARPAPACEPPSLPAEGAAGSGTTVIININNPPSLPEPGPQMIPAVVLPVLYGGLAGPFHYPEDHHFLGYGPGIRSPSLFGGLGLNAGNGFGTKSGTPCGSGFDCMFGPDLKNP